MARSKKQRKGVKTYRKRTYRKKAYRNYKGGCGDSTCSMTPTLFKGGHSGSESLADLPISKFYPLNEYNNDPNDMQVSARNLIGGKSRKKRRPKIKGGGLFDSMFGSSGNINNSASFGTVVGNQLFSNNMGNSQPIERIINQNNPALV